MDLRIQGGGYATGAHDPQWGKRRQDYDALAKALNEGDLPGANEAYAAIIGQLPIGGRVSPDSFLGKMGVALRSADLALARQLMTQGGMRTAQASNADVSSNSRSSAQGSPTLALNQAIQAGDQARARIALQAMVEDLQQLAGSVGFSGAAYGGARAYAAASPSAMAANNLLQNPDFRTLQEAILRGDPTGMKAAWARLMSGSTETSSKKPEDLGEDEGAETEASGLWEMQSATVS